MKMEIDVLHYLLAETCKWGLGLVLDVSSLDNCWFRGISSGWWLTDCGRKTSSRWGDLMIMHIVEDMVRDASSFPPFLFAYKK